MWLIWCEDVNDWLRELPSKVDDGGEAVLAFTTVLAARQRAAKHYGKNSYGEAKAEGWCRVVGVPSEKGLKELSRTLNK
jgi:hypothetical protein